MCVCVGVGWGRVRRAELVAVAASRWVDRAGRCCSKLLLLRLLLLLLLAACGACCIVSQGATRQLPTSPFPRFRGCALPIGKTGGGCDEQARARCCVGAAVGFAAARRTLRWIFKLLAACLALFLFFCCRCRRGCVDASASCAATRRFSAATQAQDAELSVSAAAAGAAVAIVAAIAAFSAAASATAAY